MIFKKIAFAACLLTIFSLSAFAQDDTISLRNLITKTTQYTQNYPAEKVYLHFDKPYYAVGDTIWFKAYVTLEQNQLSAISRVVYVDMINNRDSVVQSLRLPVVNGIAYGNIVLPQVSFIEGNYHIRAYTNWMRNFDAGYFFTKNITVGNTVDKDDPVDTHISFINAVANNNTEKIIAHITYKTQDGAPLPAKRVTWKVQSDDETIDKGKGVTDANGILELSFTSNKHAAFASADLTTTLEINYKKSVTNTFPLKTAAIPKDVQFFPEGGNMLSGVHAKIAFKAINSNGMGVNIKGVVTDDANNEVAQFASQHLGMGEFTFQPETGKNYKAMVSFSDGTKSSYDLPKVLDEGIYLSVNNSNPDSLTVKLASNPAFLEKFKNTLFYIVAQSGGNVYYAAQTQLQNLTYVSVLPKSKFPTGILQFSLLTAEGDPLSERLVFIQRDDLLNVSINTDKPAYLTRQKVHMTLTVKNKNLPDVGTFSMAVIDENKVPYDEDNETTILSSLLLTSELKGYIEKPNYYFNHVDAKKTDDLDVLMLTQGYRRFDYSDIVAGKKPQLFYLPEQGIKITGMLRTSSGIAVPRGNIHMAISDKLLTMDATTDESGRFVFTNLNFKDSSQVIISAKNNQNYKNLVVTADAETAPTMVKNINSPDNVQNIDSTLSVYLKNTKRQYAATRMLKEVVVVAKSEVKKPSHMDYSSLTGLSPQPDHIVNSSQLSGCNFLLDCLQGTLFGFTYSDNNFYLTRDYNQNNKSTPAAIYYNGTPVDASYLANIDPKTVESVETFLNDGLSSINKMTNTKGVIVINGKPKPKGEKISLAQLKDMMPQNNVITISPLGYAKYKEFYVPKFSVPKSNPTYSDLRTTIYWNPKIFTDATGKASFDFFNADGKGPYRVVLEGIDADGNLAHYIYHYKVD
ncbi:Ig-like domain-containing protein [Mucilaginibacter sp.]